MFLEHSGTEGNRETEGEVYGVLVQRNGNRSAVGRTILGGDIVRANKEVQ